MVCLVGKHRKLGLHSVKMGYDQYQTSVERHFPGVFRQRDTQDHRSVHWPHYRCTQQGLLWTRKASLLSQNIPPNTQLPKQAPQSFAITFPAGQLILRKITWETLGTENELIQSAGTIQMTLWVSPTCSFLVRNMNTNHAGNIWPWKSKIIWLVFIVCICVHTLYMNSFYKVVKCAFLIFLQNRESQPVRQACYTKWRMPAQEKLWKRSAL